MKLIKSTLKLLHKKKRNNNSVNLVYCLLFYSLGISLIAFLPHIPSLPIFYIALLIGIIILILMFLFYYFPLVLMVSSMLLGIAIGLLYGQHILENILPDYLQNQTIELQGIIIDIPNKSNQCSRFDFVLTPNQHITISGKIKLSWYHPPILHAGDIWTLSVRLKRPHSFSSPYTFDAEAWAIRSGITAMGYVLTGQYVKRDTSILSRLNALRESIHLHIQNATSIYDNPVSSSILSALLVGYKSGIPPALWKTFTVTGTAHLVVISGLHIGFVALLGYWLMLFLGRYIFVPWITLPLPHLANIFSLILAIGYALLAGFDIPVQRALMMILVARIGPIFSLRPAPSTLIITALAVVLTLQPLAITSTGFWYSFWIVAVLLYYFSNRFDYQATRWRKFIKPQWVAFCAISPLLLFNTQAVSLLSPLINFIAIPFCSLLLVPMLLFSVPLTFFLPKGTSWLWLILDRCTLWFVDALTYITPFCESLAWQLSMTMAALICTVLGVLLLLSPPQLQLRKISLFFFLPLIFPKIDTPKYGTAAVTIFDVGQGLAVLIQTQNHTLLYDTGDKFGEHKSIADHVIIPWLTHQNIKKLDLIVISHDDQDHTGGLKSLTQYSKNTLVISGTPIKKFPNASLATKHPDQWVWDGITFKVIRSHTTYKKTNDQSCILRINSETDSILLPGDISTRVETKLVQEQKILPSTYLIAPHHGSRYSLSNTFLDAVQPSAILFSSGYCNRFKHPEKSTLQRAQNCGADLWNTASHGTLSLILGSNKSTQVSGYRLSQRRYWWY